MKKYRGPDSVRAEDLQDARRFFEKTKALRRRAGITARDLWEFRARALRRGIDPVGLFIWMCFHPEEARRQVTNTDEDNARASWRRLQQTPEPLVGKLAELFSIEKPPSSVELLARIKRRKWAKSVQRNRVPIVRHRRARRRGA